MLRLGRCGAPEAGICTHTEKKKTERIGSGWIQRGEAEPCVNAFIGESDGAMGEAKTGKSGTRIETAEREETKLGRWSEIE